MYKNYTLKNISRTYKALSRWNVLYNDKFDPDKFKGLVSKLKNRVVEIAKQQCGQFDDIRFASEIIVDLKDLEQRDLVIRDSQKELLVSLMKCLSTSIDNSEVNDLKEGWPKKNILSSLESFANIVAGLENKFDLIKKCDQELIKIRKKLSTVSYGEEISKIVNRIKSSKGQCREVSSTCHNMTVASFEQDKYNEDLQVSKKRKETFEHSDTLNTPAIVPKEQESVCTAQEALRETISNQIPSAEVGTAKQNPSLPSSKKIEVKLYGSYAAVVCSLSLAMLLDVYTNSHK